MRAEDIEGRSFFIEFRGYDRNEVDQFLREVAEYVRSQSTSIDVDQFDALGDEIAKVLRAAYEAADAVQARAQEEAERMRTEAAPTPMDDRPPAGDADPGAGTAEELALQTLRRDAERARAEVLAQEDRLRELLRTRDHIRTELEDVRSQVELARRGVPNAVPGLPAEGAQALPALRARLEALQDEVELALMAIEDDGICDVPQQQEHSSQEG